MNMRQIDEISKEEVVKTYLKTNLNLKQAAKKLDCSMRTLPAVLKKFELKPKPRSRCTGVGSRTKFKELADKEWLKKELETKTYSQIAEAIGTTPGNVADKVLRYGLRAENYDPVQAMNEGRKKRYPNGRFGKEASNWKGGRRKTGKGYIYVHMPDHPHACKAGYVMEHRLAAEKKIGRYLDVQEDVHHVNEDKLDNRPENLMVLTRSEHKTLHHKQLRDEISRLELIRSDLESKASNKKVEAREYRVHNNLLKEYVSWLKLEIETLKQILNENNIKYE